MSLPDNIPPLHSYWEYKQAKEVFTLLEMGVQQVDNKVDLREYNELWLRIRAFEAIYGMFKKKEDIAQ